MVTEFPTVKFKLAIISECLYTHHESVSHCFGYSSPNQALNHNFTLKHNNLDNVNAFFFRLFTFLTFKRVTFFPDSHKIRGLYNKTT